MKRIIALLVMLGASDASAQRTSVSPTPERAVRRPSRDLALEQAIITRRQKVGSVLNAKSRARLDSIAVALTGTMIKNGQEVDAGVFAREQVKTRFAEASARQTDLMTFYVLAGVAARLEPQLSSRGEMQSERLQQVMDKLSKLYATLSNMMKKTSATSDAIISNMK